jgi:hypothetical protein
MASEMRRAAKALVETRKETFESRHPLEESRVKLQRAIDALALKDASMFRASWREEKGRAYLDAEFVPAPRIQRFLRMMSIAMTLLVAASAWLIFSDAERTASAFLVPLFTALAIFAFPFVAVALGSQREANESRIRRAIRRTLLDEQDLPRKRWDDED